MEAEKLAEFITYTNADPIVAKHILQKENWDVENGVKLFTVLHGLNPLHHSVNSQMKNIVTTKPSSYNTKCNNKPPIAPKPQLINNATLQKIEGHKLPPLSMSKTKLITIPKSSDVLETLPSYIPFSRSNLKSQNYAASLNDITPTPSVSDNNVFSDNVGRSMGNAKNALLMEKVRGFPSTDTSKKSPLNPLVTLNNSCIIAINNNRDGPHLDGKHSNNNNNSHLNTPYTNEYHASTTKAKLPVNSSAQLQLSRTRLTNHLSSSMPSASSCINKTVKNSGINNASNCTTDVHSKEKKNHYIECDKTVLNTNHEKVSHDLIDKHMLNPHSKYNSVSLANQGSNNEDQVDHAIMSNSTKSPFFGSVTNTSLSAPCSPAKPILQKSENIDREDYYKKLSRGISKATDNVNIVSKARTEFAQEIWEAMDSDRSPFFVDTPIFTFTLPDLSIYSEEFRLFLERDLIENSSLVSLESAGRLNWWAMIGVLPRLWPLATSGDGNCLLHAASLGMWGFHDRLLTLRKALYEFLTRSQYSKPLWRRWKYQLAQQNKETGLVYNSEEWESEWANVIRLASSVPRSFKNGEDTTTGSVPNLSIASSKRLSNGFLSSHVNEDNCEGHVYESLEEIHVLALAHVLRRPIIVVADVTLKDVSGEPLAPILFGGTYLPLECPPNECQRSPLLLAYDAAHFSALVAMDNQQDLSDGSHIAGAIPITDGNNDLLPIQFSIDPGEQFLQDNDNADLASFEKLYISTQQQSKLLHDYLDVRQFPIPPSYLDAAVHVPDEDVYENNQIEVDKKSSESSFDSDEGPPYIDAESGMFVGKGKASKQLQTVVKQFGSIGKQMSKRLKKNLGTLSKFSRAGSFKNKNDYTKRWASVKSAKMLPVSLDQNYILAACIHAEKRHAYQEEMIRNYLNTARLRFEKDTLSKWKQNKELSKQVNEQLEQKLTDEGPVECVNPGCNLYGTAMTSYMCSSCFQRQKEREHEYKKQNTSTSNSPNIGSRAYGPHYGAGKSKFYADLDADAAKNLKSIPVTHGLSNIKDNTIYLSNSTFFNDSSSNSTSNLLNSSSHFSKNSNNSSLNTNCAKQTTKGNLISTSSSSNYNSQISNLVVTSHASQSTNNITVVAVNEPKISSVTSSGVPKPCINKGCQFFGSGITRGFCSKCYQEGDGISKNVLVQQVDDVKI